MRTLHAGCRCRTVLLLPSLVVLFTIVLLSSLVVRIQASAAASGHRRYQHHWFSLQRRTQEQQQQQQQQQTLGYNNNPPLDVSLVSRTTLEHAVVVARGEDDDGDEDADVSQFGQRRRRMARIMRQRNAIRTVSMKLKQRFTKPSLPTLSIPSFATDKTPSFYGFTPEFLSSSSSSSSSAPPKNPGNSKKKRLKETMAETVQEMELMRSEMEQLKKELDEMKRQIVLQQQQRQHQQIHGSEDDDGSGRMLLAEKEEDIQKRKQLQQQQRQLAFDRLASEVEQWANQMISETTEDGWAEIECNKMFRNSYNADGRTQAWLKWMKDSRIDWDAVEQEQAQQQQPPLTANTKKSKQSKYDTRDYPCVKVTSVIDAPLEDVCWYLSQEDHLPEYNDMILYHADVEEVAPHAKICWSQTPQILFIKPREIITFCHHKWIVGKRGRSSSGSSNKSGASQNTYDTQVLVNQAINVVQDDDDDSETDDVEKSSSVFQLRKHALNNISPHADPTLPKAYALRGANFIGRDPNDPDHKTRITIVAHANPGDDVPNWAMRTAINALAPLEPFKLFKRINDAVLVQQQHKQQQQRHQAVSSSSELFPSAAASAAWKASIQQEQQQEQQDYNCPVEQHNQEQEQHQHLQQQQQQQHDYYEQEKQQSFEARSFSPSAAGITTTSMSLSAVEAGGARGQSPPSTPTASSSTSSAATTTTASIHSPNDFASTSTTEPSIVMMTSLLGMNAMNDDGGGGGSGDSPNDYLRQQQQQSTQGQAHNGFPQQQQQQPEQQQQPSPGVMVPRKHEPRRTTRPAGIASLGYASFWPKGGGLLVEGGSAAAVDDMRTGMSVGSSSSSDKINNNNEDTAEIAQ